MSWMTTIFIDHLLTVPTLRERFESDANSDRSSYKISISGDRVLQCLRTSRSPALKVERLKLASSKSHVQEVVMINF